LIELDRTNLHLVALHHRQIENRIDFYRLAVELRQLHQTLEREGTEPAQKLAAGAVAAEEQSALQKDGPKALEYLKTAGTWALRRRLAVM
jgi:hypothetical protein